MEIKPSVQIVFCRGRESCLDWREIEGLTFAPWRIIRGADKL
jgi:hypothetical protein